MWAKMPARFQILVVVPIQVSGAGLNFGSGSVPWLTDPRIHIDGPSFSLETLFTEPNWLPGLLG